MKITATFIKSLMKTLESLSISTCYNVRLEFDTEYEKIIRFEDVDNTTFSLYFYNIIGTDEYGMQITWLDLDKKSHWAATYNNLDAYTKDTFLMTLAIDIVQKRAIASEYISKQYEAVYAAE